MGSPGDDLKSVLVMLALVGVCALVAFRVVRHPLGISVNRWLWSAIYVGVFFVVVLATRDMPWAVRGILIGGVLSIVLLFVHARRPE